MLPLNSYYLNTHNTATNYKCYNLHDKGLKLLLMRFSILGICLSTQNKRRRNFILISQNEENTKLVAYEKSLFITNFSAQNPFLFNKTF